jgi:sugar/nucleoside kinase (ribokinase family)
VTPELVLLGNLLVDDLVFPDGRTRMGQAGGAMLYASLAAALWSGRVGCVSLRGDDYPAEALEQLRRRGVALDGIVPLHGPGLRTWLLYEDRVRRVVHQLGRPTHEAVSPEPAQVPESWRAARMFHLGPMPLAVQARLAGRLGAGGALLSIDPYELVTEESLPRWRDVLRHADAFFPSDDDLLLEGADTDPRATLRRLAGGRLRFVVWKRGANGGLLWDAREDRFHEWDARTDAVADPTGAGDSFAAGFLTALLDGRAIPDCLRRGVVTASFAIEAWGAASLLAATPADAQARLRAWYGEEVAT